MKIIDRSKTYQLFIETDKANKWMNLKRLSIYSWVHGCQWVSKLFRDLNYKVVAVYMECK